MHPRSCAPGASAPCTPLVLPPVLGLRAASPGCAAHACGPARLATVQLCRVTLARCRAGRFSECAEAAPLSMLVPPLRAGCGSCAGRPRAAATRPSAAAQLVPVDAVGPQARAPPAAAAAGPPSPNGGIGLWQRSKACRPGCGGRCQSATGRRVNAHPRTCPTCLFCTPSALRQ